MRLRRLLVFLPLLLLEGFASRDALTVRRDDRNLYILPRHDPIAMETNWLWQNFDFQASPTPHIAEGMFTLYGYSETAYGVVNLRALDYEQCLGYGTCVHNREGDLYRFLRDCGTDRFRNCLADRGYYGVLALKADDVGREADVSFWNDLAGAWTPPIRLLVLDSLGGGWTRLRDTYHPFDDDVPMRWLGDVSKDALETAGLEHLVRNNRSGFMRLVFSEVGDKVIYWPDYGEPQ